MKHSALLFVFSLLIYFSTGLINVSAQESLAVLDTITDEQVDTSVQVPVTEKLIEIFINRTDYRLIDRTDITSVLEEQNFQLSGMVKTEEVREVGRYLGADYICLAKVSLVGQTYFVSAKLIDVRDGTIVSQATDDQPGSIDVVLQLTERVGQKLVQGYTAPRTAAEESDWAEDSSTQEEPGGEFVFSEPVQQEEAPRQPSGPSGPSGSSGVSRSAGPQLPPSLLYFGLTLPVFAGQAYDSLTADVEGIYGSSLDTWGVGIRMRAFVPMTQQYYLYLDGSAAGEYVDTGAEESLNSLLVYEALIGTGMYTNFGTNSFGYFGAGLGFLYVMLGEDIDAWDGYTADGAGGFAYNLELGWQYAVNPAFYIDLKLSLSSAMLEEEELFGLSSQGFGSVQFGLMAGMKL